MQEFLHLVKTELCWQLSDVWLKQTETPLSLPHLHPQLY